MKLLKKFRYKLISFLSLGEPVMLNWCINPSFVDGDTPVAYIPASGKKFTANELMKKGVLTPVINVIK